MRDPWLVLTIFFEQVVSFLILWSIAPVVFPTQFFYIIAGAAIFYLFSKIDIDILSLFSNHLFVASIFFLIIPLIIGQVTRGAVRWIQIGPITIQPSEMVRPFIILFFANFLTAKKVGIARFIKAVAILAIPLFLILIQPSLGVTILTAVGFFGALIASDFPKKYIVMLVFLGIIALPVVWLLLAPYQRSRVNTFLSPTADPTGAGYNSIQSMISVGSGRLWGRGLGGGVQTQLSFLPERHTDFIFASVSEELGFVGAFLLLSLSMFLLLRLINIVKFSKNPTARCFVSGVFLTIFVQTMIHVGMNMGLFPITGVPLPLVSAGGSSLLATMAALGMVLSSKKMV